MTSERTITIKFINSSVERFCNTCHKNVQFITADEAAVFLQTSVRTVFRLVENNAVHFEEIENGLLIVCSASLASAETIDRA